MSKALFLTVHSAEGKLQRLRELALLGFESGSKLLIFSPNSQVSSYIDTYLWQFAPLSFLPHVITDSKNPSPVVISETEGNWNDAAFLLNLSPAIPSFFSEFDQVFEFWDASNSSKGEEANKHKTFYEGKGMKASLLEADKPLI